MNFQFFKNVYRYIKPYKGKFLIATLLRFTSDLSNLVPIWALGQVVHILANEPNSLHTRWIDLFVPVFIVWAIVSLYRPASKSLARYIGFGVAENAALDLKVKGLTHIYKLDTLWQVKENSGNKLKRVNHGERGLRETIRIYYSNVIEAFVNTVGVLIVFYTISIELTLALIVYITIYYAVSVYLTRIAGRQSRVVNSVEEDLEGVSFESLNNIRTIKALGLNENIIKRIDVVLVRLRREIQRRIFLFQSRNFVLATFYRIVDLSSIAYISYLVFQGYYDVSLIVLFSGYLSKMETAVDELSEITHEIVINSIYIQRLTDILNIRPTIEVDKQQLPYPTDWKKLSLENVNFSYEKGKALDNFSLEINRNEKIGIVGLSGAGKSTLFGLLLDLYENYKGKINFDGIEMNEVDRQNYIEHVATVLQETELFNATLRENIFIADTGNSDGVKVKERIDEAVRIAHLEEVIRRLPQGLDTVIGEKGVKLSGGERQRVGIARAVFRNPQILLMDEATSHLDVDSERKIQDSLHEVFKKVTAVVIAHRLSTIKEMDRIIVMDQGKVIEQGTFEELLANGGEFSKMWELMTRN